MAKSLTYVVAVALLIWMPPGFADSWYSASFPVRAGTEILDTAKLQGQSELDLDDAAGHAAPFMVDADADGLRDLVVGTFSGRFRFYKNIGTDAAPKFGAEFVWMGSGDGVAKVRNYCCVAPGPQMIDIDGDGVLDLTCGSYDPGAVYWFKGLGGNRYLHRQMLTDGIGLPVRVSRMANIAWMHWNDDGLPDLVVGDMEGNLFYGVNGGSTNNGYTPIESQPYFGSQELGKQNALKEILIAGKSPLTESHAAPATADWDSDGLTDILVGTETGAVYWLRNSGTPGFPEFRMVQELLSAGEGIDQWLDSADKPRRGIRSQIQVVDYNLDGKLDLLVGSYSTAMVSDPFLDDAKRRKLNKLMTRLKSLDAEVSFPRYGWRHHWAGYADHPEKLKESDALISQMSKYLLKADNGSYSAAHGHVWVFLRR